MSDFIFNVTGLTAADRARWESDNIELLKNTEYNTYNEEQRNRAFKDSSFYNRFKNREDYEKLASLPAPVRDSFYENSILEEKEEFANEMQQYATILEGDNSSPQENYTIDLINTFNKSIESYQENLKHVEKLYHWRPELAKGVEDVKNRALEVSNYYKKYHDDSTRMPISDDEWTSLAKEYKTLVIMNNGDTSNADEMLSHFMQDKASKNQPFIEKLFNVVRGGGAAVASEIITAAGIIYGVFTPENVIDNAVVDYANDVLETGTLIPSEQKKAKELGISNTALIKTVDEERRGWGWNTFGEITAQQGFTTGAALMSFGTSAVISKGFKGIKGLAMMNKSGLALKNTLTAINRIERGFQVVGTAGFVGTIEGVMEANSSGRDYLEKEMQRINEFEDGAIKDKINKIYSSPELFIEYLKKTGLYTEPIINALNSSVDGNIPEDLNKVILSSFYGKVVEESAKRKEESIQFAEDEAEKVRNRTALVNSAINGALNASLKLGLQAPKVQTAMKRMFPGKGSAFKIKGNKVTPKKGIVARGVGVIKEPASEFFEEAEQTFTSDVSINMSYHKMENYLHNKYHEDGQEYLNTSLGEDFKYAIDNLDWNNVVKSGIHGAIGSVLGSVTPKYRTGPKSRMVDLITGKKESWWSYAGRRLPVTYRNPLWQAIQEQREDYKKDMTDAKIIEEWIKNPVNRTKYDGVAGTFNWLKELDKAATSGDEFRFETASLGKMVHDLSILDKLKGSDFHYSLMNELQRSAEADIDSPYAKTLLSRFKQETGNIENLSDEQIIQLISSNAKNMLSKIESINEESEKLKRVFGEALDDDTKETLVWGKIAMDEWRPQLKKLESEIQNSGDYTYVEENRLPKEDAKTLIKYGSLENIKQRIQQLSKTIKSYEANLKNNRKKLDSFQQEKLKKKIKEAKKEIEILDDFTFKYDETPIIGKGQIMSLDAKDRASILNSANFSKYSQEQQDLLNDLIADLNSSDINILNNIKKAGQLQESLVAYIKQYNEIVSDPSSFNDYVLKVKKNQKELNIKVKRDVAKRNMKAQFEDLKKINNYEDFADAVDDIIRKNPTKETETILEETLKGNALYKKYVKDGNLASGIMNYVLKNSRFKDISNDDLKKLIVFSQYLSRKGIDIENYDAVLQALNETSEDGSSVLTKLINDINSYLPDTAKLNFDNIGELVHNYREALRGFKQNQKIVDKITKPVDVKTTTNTSDSQKSTHSFLAGKTSQEQEQEKDNVSNENAESHTIDDAVSQLVTFIFEEFEDEEYKMKAIATINIAASQEKEKEEFSTQSFYARLQDIINDYKKSNVQEAVITANILERVLLKSKIEDKQASIEESKEELRKHKEETEKAKLDPPSLLRLNPNNPIVKFIERLGGVKYLQEHGNRRTQNPNNATLVRYVYLPDLVDSENEGKTLTQMVQESIGDSYQESSDAPILAVIEDEKEGTITIKDKKYVPIGLMPSSNTNVITAKIREAALRTPGELASEGNTLLSSQMIIHSSKLKGVTQEEGDNTIKSLIVASYNSSEENHVNSINEIPEQERKETIRSILQKFKIVSEVIKKKINDTIIEKVKKSLVYKIKTGKGDGSDNIIRVLTNFPNQVLVSFNGEKIPFTELLQKHLEGEDVKEAIFSLKRMKSFGEAILSRLNEFNNIEGPALKEGVFLSEEYEDSYGTFIKHLNNTFSDYFNFDANIDIKIDPATKTPGLYLDNYFLGEFKAGENVEQDIVTILANLCLDKDKNPRKGLIFQVDYDLVSDATKKSGYYKVFSELIEDGILRMGIHDLYRNIENVTLDIPQQYTSLAPESKPIITNSDNANTDNSNDDLINVDGQLIDPITGHTPDGNLPKIEVTSEMEKAESIVQQMLEDSKDWNDPNEEEDTLYENKNTGEKRVRVSSLVTAIDGIDKFNPKSPYKVPSTGVGNIVDLIVRTLAKNVSNTIPFNENFSNDDIFKIVRDISNVINYYESQGWTFHPEGIRAVGNIEVEGEILPYAGTLDLLAYNSKGEFMIIDVKTTRGGIEDTTEEGKDKLLKLKKKWARQLNLYAKALSQKYGIVIKDTKILNVGVSYDLGANEYITDKNTGTVKVSNSRNKNNIGKPLQVKYLGIQRDVQSKQEDPKGHFINIGFPLFIDGTPINVFDFTMLSEEEQSLMIKKDKSSPENTGVEEKVEDSETDNENLDYGNIYTGRKKEGYEDSNIDTVGTENSDNPFDSVIFGDNTEDGSVWDSLDEDTKKSNEEKGIAKEDIDNLPSTVKENIKDCSKR